MDKNIKNNKKITTTTTTTTTGTNKNTSTTGHTGDKSKESKVFHTQLRVGRKKKHTALYKAFMRKEEQKKREKKLILNEMEKTMPDLVYHLKAEDKFQDLVNDVPEEGALDVVTDEGEMIPELEEWDPLQLPKDFFMLLLGKRRTGKSVFAQWFLQFYKDRFQLVWCMTNTACNGFWQPFVGKAFTFDHFDPAAVQVMLERNNKIIEKYGKNNPITDAKASSLIILDDVIADKHVHDDPVFRMLAVEGRHHKISVIVMSQDPKALGPAVRENVDVCVMFNQKTARDKEAACEGFINDLDKNEALAMMNKYAIGHSALVCTQAKLVPDILDVFQKSTGDKMKLDDPLYMLGGPEQKKIIQDERDERETHERDKKAQTQAELMFIKYSGKVKLDGEQAPGEFVVDKFQKKH